MKYIILIKTEGEENCRYEYSEENERLAKITAKLNNWKYKIEGKTEEEEKNEELAITSKLSIDKSYKLCHITYDEYKNERVKVLKIKLYEYDYIGIKIAMGVESAERYEKEIAESEKIREEIRKLENE